MQRKKRTAQDVTNSRMDIATNTICHVFPESGAVCSFRKQIDGSGSLKYHNGMGTTDNALENNGRATGSQRTQFKKGNKIGNRFNKDNQPPRRPRKVVKLLEEVTEVPRQEISNVIRSIFFDKTNKELEGILKDENAKAFIQICARVALNCRNEGKTADFETLLGWAYVKKQELRVEIDDLSRMTREEKEEEAIRILQESGIEIEEV